MNAPVRICMALLVTAAAVTRPGYALTLDDIPVSPACSTAFTPLYAHLERLPARTDFIYASKKDFFDNTGPLDSARTVLRQGIRICDTLRACPYALQLHRAVLHHMLGRLRDTAASARADSLLATLRASAPESTAAAWMQALRCLQNGRLPDGLARLDRIASGPAISEAFWRSYAEHAYTALIPGTAAALPLDIFSRAPDAAPLSDSASREVPELNTWSIVRPDTGRDLPGYVYRLSFSFPKKWDRSMMARQGYMTTARTGGSMAPQYLSSFFLNKLFFTERRTESDIFVVIDPNGTTELLQSFIRERLPRVFDSVAVEDTYTERNGFSIKCFQKGAPPDAYGSYVHMVGLKRFYADDRMHVTQPGRPARQFSYLVTLVSCMEDRDKAAARFMQVAETFLR